MEGQINFSKIRFSMHSFCLITKGLSEGSWWLHTSTVQSLYMMIIFQLYDGAVWSKRQKPYLAPRCTQFYTPTKALNMKFWLLLTLSMPGRFSIKGGAFESSKFECVLKQTQYRRSQSANSSCLLFSLPHLEKKYFAWKSPWGWIKFILFAAFITHLVKDRDFNITWSRCWLS